MFTISEPTQKLLKNFAGLSNSVLLQPGTAQRAAFGKSVLAIAAFPDAWPKETGIYDLQSFLGVLSLFKAPTIQFDEDGMVITNEPRGSSQVVRYRYSHPSTIRTISDVTLPVDNPAIEFTLSELALSQLKRTALMLKIPNVSIKVDRGVVSLVASDPKIPTSHMFNIDVPASDVKVHRSDFTRSLPLKVEHVSLLLDGAYDVRLSDWKYAHFQHKTTAVAYFLAEQTLTGDSK